VTTSFKTGSSSVGRLLVAAIALGTIPALPDKDCADFATQAEAQTYLLPGDPHGLDADDDGTACDSLS
jgi:hypothetical protein